MNYLVHLAWKVLVTETDWVVQVVEENGLVNSSLIALCYRKEYFMTYFLTSLFNIFSPFYIILSSYKRKCQP